MPLRRTATAIVLAALTAGIAGAGLAPSARAEEEPETRIFVLDLRSHKLNELELGEGSMTDPAWSPDGRKLAFSVYRCEGCPPTITIVGLSGSSRTPQRVVGTGLRPRWSPDGSKIAYVDTSGAVGLVGASGTGRRTLAKVGLSTDSPTWSPDGKRIAFTAQLPSARFQLFSVAARGGTPRKLTGANGAAVGPSWSPDGKTIAFSSRRPNGTWHLYSLPAGGGPLSWLGAKAGESDAQVPPLGPADTQPAWSPDGRRLAFVRQLPGSPGALYVMPSRGGKPTRLTAPALDALQPSWSPDGTRLAFVGREPH